MYDWSNEEDCLKAVLEDGLALEFVDKQTEAICIEAVRHNGWALQFVKEQTEKKIALGSLKWA